MCSTIANPIAILLFGGNIVCCIGGSFIAIIWGYSLSTSFSPIHFHIRNTADSICLISSNLISNADTWCQKFNFQAVGPLAATRENRTAHWLLSVVNCLILRFDATVICSLDIHPHLFKDLICGSTCFPRRSPALRHCGNWLTNDKVLCFAIVIDCSSRGVLSRLT